MKINKNNLMILLLVGILLLVIAIPTGEKQISEVSGTEIEQRLEKILSGMEGVGNVKVMITFQESDVVEGVAVIAEGGGNAVVVRNITEVIQALFDVDSHKIKVIESK